MDVAPPALVRLSRPAQYLEPPLVYGPITSRRFGRSLGVNLLPARVRLCNFDCGYCQCGGLRARRRQGTDPPYPTLAELERELSAALAADAAVDDICFAGAGEPTLHPLFRQAVLLARVLRNRFAPRAAITVLSNGVAAGKPSVRAALALADRPVLKLDAANDQLLRALNGAPRRLSVRHLIETYSTLIGIETQTILVRGAVDNATPEALDQLGEALRFIHPRRAQVGTITRAPGAIEAGRTFSPLSPEDLEAAVTHLRRVAPGIEIDAY